MEPHGGDYGLHSHFSQYGMAIYYLLSNYYTIIDFSRKDDLVTFRARWVHGLPPEFPHLLV